MVRVPEAQSDRYWARQSQATCAWFQNHIVRVPKACQTAAMRGEAKLRTYNLKKTLPPQSWSQAVVCVSTPRMYPRSFEILWNDFFKREKQNIINAPHDTIRTILLDLQGKKSAEDTLQTARLLMEHGLRDLINEADSLGNTPLHHLIGKAIF